MWETTFRAVKDLLVVLDRGMNIVRVNRDFQGRSPEDMLGGTCCGVFGFCGDDRLHCPVAGALAGGREASHEVFLPDEEKALLLTATPVGGDHGEIVFVVMSVRDESRTLGYAAQLSQSAKLAAIGEMAAGVAHELNSPLTAVIGNANLLLRRVPEGDKSRKMLVDIKECGQRCKSIISNLLTFARQDNYSFEPVSLPGVVESALELTGYQFEKSGVTIETSAGPGLPEVMGNRQQIEQVLVNLLLNAHHALSRAETKRITITTDFGTFQDGRLCVAVSVADTGVGMTNKELSKIFNPFYTTKEAEKGTGLGLSVSMGIAKAHGGTIEVESKPQSGSVFTLLIPLAEGYALLGQARKGGEKEGQGKVRPELLLAGSLGSFLRQFAEGRMEAVTVECRGPSIPLGTGLFSAALLEGLLGGASMGNWPLGARARAREQGIKLVECGSGASEEYAFSIHASLEWAGGRVSVTGALIGRGEPRLVELGVCRIEAPLEGCLLLFSADDRPGLVGNIATILATRGIGILQMRSGIDSSNKTAVAAFQVDSFATDEILEELKSLPGLISVRRVNL